MINLNIDDLKPGMILARPVRNHQGVLLLDAGARISKKNIRIFKSWGVLEVSIKGNPDSEGGAGGPTEIKVKESIEKAGLNLIGVVINKFKLKEAGYNQYYYYYSRYYKK